MKRPATILLFIIPSIVNFHCTKSGGDGNGNGNGNGNGGGTPKPAVTIQLLQPMNIYLPNNCSRSFIIKNTGAQGSTLNYSVFDNGALGGFLDFTNTTGALSINNTATINVTVDPQFVSSQPSIIGSTLILDVSTPDASNATHTYVSVYPRAIEDQAQSILGVWSGAWNGNSFGAANPGQQSPASPVSGTWILTISYLNLYTGDISGSVYWTGNDAYWNYTFDSFGNILTATPVSFSPNFTFSFNSSNSHIYYPAVGSACDRFHVVINDLPNSTYGVYGPTLFFDFDIKPNTIHLVSGSWKANPYAPYNTGPYSINQSNGPITGHR